MNSIKSRIFGVVALSATCALAVPRVDENSVTMEQAENLNRTVTISYVLTGEPGIVTFDIETNVTGTAEWVSIGGQNIQTVAGSVNKLIGTLNQRLSFTWQPYMDWPGRTIPAANIRAVVTAWATNAPPDYMAVDLDTPTNVQFYTSADFLPGSITSKVWRTRKLLMRKIPAANVVWRMGQPADEHPNVYNVMAETAQVMLTEDYYAGVFKFTAWQYWKIQGAVDGYGRTIGSLNAWGESNDEAPACAMSWNALRNNAYNNFTYAWPRDGHAVTPSSVLGKIRAKTGIEFDLPTEAQWEYAMRAGEGDACYLGGLCNDINTSLIAWHKGNTTKTINGENVTCFSHQCGLKLPNNWGLYDMVGNGREWCLDYYSSALTGGTITPGGVIIDPKGRSVDEATAANDYRRVIRTMDTSKPWAELVGIVRNAAAQNVVDAVFTCRLFCPAAIAINPAE